MAADRRLAYAPTQWGIRVPVPPLMPGETRGFRLVRPEAAASAEVPAGD